MFILVTGASASGKSEYAECRITAVHQEERHLLYLATMQPYGEEGRARVAKHRKQRALRNFETLEWYKNLEQATIPMDSDVLLECMSNLVANEMFEEQGAHNRTVSEVTKGIENLLGQAAHVVIVTNEIFSDAVVFDGDMDSYLEYLGEINQAAAQRADEVVEVVYGIPVFHKSADARSNLCK